MPTPVEFVERNGMYTTGILLMKLFFDCFNSHLSSSSKTMKFSSKCILSPGSSNGNREPSQISQSSSLSWKLRSNRSIRSGQASPMFTTVGKKKGGAFANPEPSSPKVTCIGQVRVRTRKQGKKMRARSMRRKEASFRKTDQGFRVAAANPNISRQKGSNFEYQNHQNLRLESLPHRNQRWVHLPLTICEALRGFRADFNKCFFSCWSCKSSEKDEEDKAGGVTGGSGRGAAFAGWLASLEEGDEDRTDKLEGSQRRHVLEDIEESKKYEFVGEEEEKARVSSCIPPKNALLLIRCRSDPVKMAALANRFWESPAQKDDEREDNGDEEGEVEEDEVPRHVKIPTKIGEDGACVEQVIPDGLVEAKVVKGFEPDSTEIPEEKPENGGVNGNPQGKTSVSLPSSAVQVDLEELEAEDVQLKMLQEGEEKLKEKENKEDGQIEQRDTELASSPVIMAESSIKAPGGDEKDTTERSRDGKETATRDKPDLDYPELPEKRLVLESNQSESKKGSSSVLPECLLLMMCEPKLSMEVSKKTWISNKDFIRRLPEKPVKKNDSGNERKKRISVDSKPPLPQPPRSSCSYPAPAAGMSMATMIGQKLGESNACEPFVLKRCNSEPMKSSAILAPEACFWKKGKLEPHHPAATLGIGAAGVGF